MTPDPATQTALPVGRKARPKKSAPLSEKQLVDLLRKRFEQDAGNGAKGALIPQVRDAASFDSSRTIDALGVSYWKSAGLTLDAFECKSSRSDLLRELESPAKSDRFCQLCDRFTIVLGRADLCTVEELPPTWGLLVPRGEGDNAKLHQIRPATYLHERAKRGVADLPPAFDRSFLIALIRSTHRVSQATPEEVAEAERRGFQRGVVSGEQHSKWELERARTRLAEVDEFERGLRVRIGGYRSHLTDELLTTEEVGKLFRAVLEGETNVVALRNRMSSAARTAEQAARTAEVLATEARKHVTALDLAIGASA